MTDEGRRQVLFFIVALLFALFSLGFGEETDGSDVILSV